MNFTDIYKFFTFSSPRHDWTCAYCGHPADGWRFAEMGHIACSGCGSPVIEDGKPSIDTAPFDKALGL